MLKKKTTETSKQKIPAADAIVGTLPALYPDDPSTRAPHGPRNNSL